MTRPADVKARLENIGQIEAIVSTLRALAVAHRQEAARHLDAIRAYEATIAGALADALAADGRPETASGRGGSLLIVVGAAQGFGGAFGDRLAEAALAVPAEERRELIVIGRRTLETLEARGATASWSADAPAHVADAPDLASRLTDEVVGRIARSGAARVSVLHAEPDADGAPPTRRSLTPFDFSRFRKAVARRPLTTLPRDALLAALVDEYLFTEICDTLMLAFAAENEARAEAMARAQQNVKRIRADLAAEWRRARQEQTTTEIVEVAGRID
jgi:F-type H+-transporting ATPase subunit gamma